jgi:hypothetical protein
MFTISAFNQNKFQPAGAVFAQRVETVGGAPKGGLFSSSKTLAGRNPIMEKNMDNLTRALKDQLIVNTLAVFPSAKALVDLKITFSNIGNNDNIYLAGQATATALVNRPPKSIPNSMSPPVVKPLETEESPEALQMSEDPKPVQAMNQGLSAPRPLNAPALLSAPRPLNAAVALSGPAPAQAPLQLSGPRPMLGGRRYKKNKSNRRRTVKHRK